MKIAFLDFEFGQIYGSWRRDFLVTQAGVVIYDTVNDTIRFAEVIFKPDMNLVMRKRDSIKHKKVIETVINYKRDRYFTYDKKYRISSKERKIIRLKWHSQYSKQLVNFLNHTIRGVDNVYLFGGQEDINILHRHRFYLDNIIDIQTQLQKIYKIRYSLDLVVHHLAIENFAQKHSIESLNYKYNLPKKSKYIFNYEQKNFQAHNALADSIRLFLVYKELFER